MAFFIGVDLGKIQDPSAIAIVERRDQPRAWMPALFKGLMVRHLERIPLGTPYPDIVEHLRDLASHPDIRSGARIVVDGTGVGGPVVDLMRRAGLPCGVTPVVITNGAKATSDGTWWHVPKKDLLAEVRLLLEKDELLIAAALEEAGSLVKELSDVKAKVRPGGGVRLGADGYGEHDDLVLALSLACWMAKRPMAGFQPNPLPGMP